MCRGFPVWLKYVPGISFRTDNEPFKVWLFFPKIFYDKTSGCFDFLLMIHELCWRGRCKDSLRRLWGWWRVNNYLSLRVAPLYSLRWTSGPFISKHQWLWTFHSRSSLNSETFTVCCFRLRMSTGHRVSCKGLLVKTMWIGLPKWLWRWELECLGWCARKMMRQIQW